MYKIIILLTIAVMALSAGLIVSLQRAVELEKNQTNVVLVIAL